MPCLNVSTNVNLEGVDTSAVLADASSTVATIIGKPEAYVMVVLKGSVPMAFGGTQEPAAYGELVSIGGLNPDVNKKLSAGIASILESKLSISKSRFYLKFHDSKASRHYLSATAHPWVLIRHHHVLIAFLLFVRPILHKNMLNVCMLCIKSRSSLGLWMERNHLLDESYGVESCMNFRVPNILFIAYLRRNCGSKTSCQFNGQCL
ncbi:macrophage migration inhibitory factor homolog isoform X1 [Hordeum vulgare subsp. vulgare]|uniref:Macrophage migration inhibitory factor homolog n=1 Tax=Hordeum vulgare subsp. vulgare TaxID=112509 RepID=A0A8I6XQW4_HORVV|nr:macrophage migration inhibitory factor homolog isoform X1 [Hordeum vulgare subsp. vulgare]